MKTRISRLLVLAGLASVAIAASAPAMAHCGYGYARPHAYYHAPRVVYSPVVVYRPAPVYYAPAPVYYTQPYPAWGAIAGAAIGSTVGRGNGRIASIAAGSMIGAAVGSQLDRWITAAKSAF